jgi:beta-aspartyl-peptidase (threonine type)
VHGGAWNIPEELKEGCRVGCRRALEAGWAVLLQGGSALDAVEAAIIVLEDDPVFDAGVGSHLNRDGRVELDAILMDGATLKAGAVAAVERVRNPIRLARRVLEVSEHMMLVGAGAEQFAEEQGLPLCAPEELIVERERRRWRAHQQGACSYCAPPAVESGGGLQPPKKEAVGTGAWAEDHRLGTVGAVAWDATGGLVAGTSTGGTCCKHPGRVGDSPLVGCGCYADVEAGAVSCTGHGEAIMKIVMAKSAAEFLRAGKPPAAAAQAAVRLLAERTGGTAGLILLDRNGAPGTAFNTPHLVCGHVATDGSFVINL